MRSKSSLSARHAPLGRAVALGIATFVAVMIIGGWPWGSVRVGFSRALSEVANFAFAHVTFQNGLYAELVPLPGDVPRKPSDVVHADTSIVLRSVGRAGEARIGISLRRDAYLPLLTFIALVLAAPTDLRRRVQVLAIGLPIVIGVAVASVYLLIVQLLNQPVAVGANAWSSNITAFLFERWLLPWGNRVIAPLLLGGGLLLVSWPKKGRENVAVGDVQRRGRLVPQP